MSTPAGPATDMAQPTAPGALRIRPLPHEAAASYLHRLAGTYRLDSRQLLEGIGITVHGRPGSTPGSSEIALSPTALHHVAAFARVPDLQLALRKTINGARDPDAGDPTAHWQLPDPAALPTRTCPQCTLRHTHGTTIQAWAYQAEHRRLCPRHHRWATPPGDRASLDTRALPELAQAHHTHQRLVRRPDTTAYPWASMITTRWYDHQQHLTPRWQARLTRLAATNPPHTGGTSWARTGRYPVTYPETIALARHLTLTPRGQTSHGFLDQAAHTLGLDRLVLPPDDLLQTWIHTKQERPRHHCL
ncbi:TniQ family protein [Streptomyces sp. NPDC098789]|uniref:TniQ family protein n=1 Tax=Streptomyces sp. NPDC098789 TaxID=3366098 RepID=UPI0037FE3256